MLCFPSPTTLYVCPLYLVNSESLLSRSLIISSEATKQALQKSSVTNCQRLSYLTKCAQGLSGIERSLSNCPPVPQFFPALQLIAPIYKRALSASTFYHGSYNSRTEPTCSPVKVGQSPNTPTGQSCKYTRCKYQQPKIDMRLRCFSIVIRCKILRQARKNYDRIYADCFLFGGGKMHIQVTF